MSRSIALLFSTRSSKREPLEEIYPIENEWRGRLSGSLDELAIIQF